MKPIPTIEEYLNLANWCYQAKRVELGYYGDFFWIKNSSFTVEDLDFPKQPYCILLILYDAVGFAPVSLGKEAGWRAVGDYAVSEQKSGRSEINYGVDFELMIIERTVTDAEILDALGSNCTFIDDEQEDDSRFWQIMNKLQPYCYLSSSDKSFCTVKSKSLRDSLNTPEIFAREEQTHRDYARAERAKAWNDLGPECGTEICVEPDCSRLRIKLAGRCFLHQML